MNKRQIKHIANKLYNKLKKSGGKITGNFKKEDIHQLRVDYKKLRAFLRMLEQQKNKPGKISLSKKIKRAYRFSGKIRDLQLFQHQILKSINKEFQHPQLLLRSLQKEIKLLKPQLTKIITAIPFLKNKRKINTALPEVFTGGNLKKYIQTTQIAISALMATKFLSDKKIHMLRKKLKDLFYNFNNYEPLKSDKSVKKKWKTKDSHFPEQLLNELGIFQDKCTAIALLKTQQLSNVNQHNQETIMLLNKIWQWEKAAIKKKLIAALKSNIL